MLLGISNRNHLIEFDAPLSISLIRRCPIGDVLLSKIFSSITNNLKNNFVFPSKLPSRRIRHNGGITTSLHRYISFWPERSLNLISTWRNPLNHCVEGGKQNIPVDSIATSDHLRKNYKSLWHINSPGRSLPLSHLGGHAGHGNQTAEGSLGNGRQGVLVDPLRRGPGDSLISRTIEGTLCDPWTGVRFRGANHAVIGSTMGWASFSLPGSWLMMVSGRIPCPFCWSIDWIAFHHDFILISQYRHMGFHSMVVVPLNLGEELRNKFNTWVSSPTLPSHDSPWR